MNLNSALVEDIISLDEVKADMAAVLSALKDDFTRSLSIRTSPGVPLPCCRSRVGLLVTPETNTRTSGLTHWHPRSCLVLNENSESSFRKK